MLEALIAAQVALVLIIIVVSIFSTSSSDEGMIGSSSSSGNMKARPKKSKYGFVLGLLFMLNSLFIAKVNISRSDNMIKLLKDASSAIEDVELIEKAPKNDN